MEPFFPPPARKILPGDMVNNRLLPPQAPGTKQPNHCKVSISLIGTAFA
jgi:hypothetical protein